MNGIYVVNLSKKFYQHEFEKAQEFVSTERKRQIRRFRFQDDARRALIGELLVRYIILNIYPFKNNQIIFRTNLFGKPFIIGFPEFEYNISHSGDYIVCAFANNQIGIDIEKIMPIEIDVMKLILHKNEYEAFINDANGPIHKLYEYWTLKESYVKAIGQGLSIPVQEIDFSQIGKGKEKYFSQLLNKHIFLHQYDIHNDYKMSTCSYDEEFPQNIKRMHVHPEEYIYDYFNAKLS